MTKLPNQLEIEAAELSCCGKNGSFDPGFRSHATLVAAAAPDARANLYAQQYASARSWTQDSVEAQPAVEVAPAQPLVRQAAVEAAPAPLFRPPLAVETAPAAQVLPLAGAQAQASPLVLTALPLVLAAQASGPQATWAQAPGAT